MCSLMEYSLQNSPAMENPAMDYIYFDRLFQTLETKLTLPETDIAPVRRVTSQS